VFTDRGVDEVEEAQEPGGYVELLQTLPTGAQMVTEVLLVLIGKCAEGIRAELDVGLVCHGVHRLTPV
jgi:hypothetical protein